MCGLVRQQLHHLRTCWKYKLSGPTPDLLNQKLGNKTAVCVLADHPGDFEPHSHVRTIGTDEEKFAIGSEKQEV